MSPSSSASGYGSSQVGSASRVGAGGSNGGSGAAGGWRPASRNASRHRFVAIRYSQARSELRSSKPRRPRHALSIVSCKASSASCIEPRIR